eukprot:jgi/Phyca11/104719/e_gw1.9.890.1
MKLLVCQETSSVDIYELGEHHSRAQTPAKVFVTLSQREFIKELARENLMPVRIRNALGRKFGMRHSALPSLRTVQNIVHHYLGVKARTNAFTFTNDYDDCGLPKVGSDGQPFLVGMSTKALLRNTVRDAGAFVLHFDLTFKLNCVGYPVFVCGMTDASRTFHLLALFISSQMQEE